MLPCYESDGPDGHEAKARRRLLRDLWAKVSGDFEPIELSEVDDDTDAVQVQPEVKVIQQETKATPALPFTDQIEQATKSRDLDVIARAIVAAKLPDDETAFLKSMVTEARKRLQDEKR